MADPYADVLSPAICRAIGDKLYDKRKSAALEVEQIVKKLSHAGGEGNAARVRALVDKVN
jgi:vacuole morphology and inheritance protein 14